jgi:hypothetical protein
MKADELLKAMDEALYKVYNKQEEEEEGLTPENRQTYGGKELRNMFIGSLNYPSDNIKDFVQSLRDAIDKMPDEWIAEFLRVQNGDTVEPVTEALNEDYELPEDEWYYKHDTDSVYYDISYNIPVITQVKIDAGKGEDGNPEFWFNGNHEKFAQLPYKVQSKLPRTGPYKTVKECMDAYLLWFRAIQKNEGIKLNGMKISKPYYGE